jgi:hypothetical protein
MLPKVIRPVPFQKKSGMTLHRAGIVIPFDERMRPPFLAIQNDYPRPGSRAGTKQEVRVSMTTETNEQDVIAPGATASGASYSNRMSPCEIAGETTPSLTEEVNKPQHTGTTKSPRRRTIKSRKSGKTSRRKGTALKGQTTRPHVNWQHPPRGSFEAAEFLAGEGYIVAKPIGPDPVFDLMGRSRDQEIIVKVVRPREPVRGAARVAELYLPEILMLKPYYRSPEDFVEIWIYSREVGLARYRVFDWGIANAATITKLIKTPPAPVRETQNIKNLPANGQTRNSPCPVSVSG